MRRPDPSEGASLERLREAARALSRMPSSMATAIDVVGLDVPDGMLSAAASTAAAEFGVVAIVGKAPVLSVRFERS